MISSADICRGKEIGKIPQEEQRLPNPTPPTVARKLRRSFRSSRIRMRGLGFRMRGVGRGIDGVRR
jgi:hypothetical protein